MVVQHRANIGIGDLLMSAVNDLGKVRLQNKSIFQQTQNIRITFVQCWANVFDVGPALYKCYTNVMCRLCTWSDPVSGLSPGCKPAVNRETRGVIASTEHHQSIHLLPYLTSSFNYSGHAIYRTGLRWGGEYGSI